MGLNCTHVLCQKVIRNSHMTYNRTFQQYFLDAKFQPLGICCSQLYPKETTIFWFVTLLDSFYWVWGNNSSKQCQIELKLWPRGVFIVVQMPFRAFWKSQIFTETGRTQSLSFCSNFNPNLSPEDGQNQK